MLEIAPGIYVTPQMPKSVRERLWDVMLNWASLIPADGGIVLVWRDNEAPSGLSLRTLGWSKKELFDHEGLWLSMNNLTQAQDINELEDLARKAEANFEDEGK
jgi:CRISPR-associated protein Cas2